MESWLCDPPLGTRASTPSASEGGARLAIGPAPVLAAVAFPTPATPQHKTL